MHTALPVSSEGQQRTERATGSKDANEDTEEDLEGDEDEEEHTGTGVAERCMSGQVPLCAPARAALSLLVGEVQLVICFRIGVQEAGPSGEGHGYFAQTPEGTQFSAPSFGDLNLSRPLVKACTALGYQKPTPIQVGHYLITERCLPIVRQKRRKAWCEALTSLIRQSCQEPNECTASLPWL